MKPNAFCLPSLTSFGTFEPTPPLACMHTLSSSWMARALWSQSEALQRPCLALTSAC